MDYKTLRKLTAKSWVSQCLKKKRYRTEEFVSEKVKHLKERVPTIRYYYCQICLGFHLTKKALRK